MSDLLRRSQVAAQARAWLGTPYHHHGRVRGVGVDCAQLLAAVFEACGLVPHQELGNYPAQWHLHRGAELFIDRLQAAGARPVQTPELGDVGVWRYGRAYSHGGVVVGQGAGGVPLIVHAYVQRGVVLSLATDEPLAGHDCKYWSVI